jgi:hypothetical protein
MTTTEPTIGLSINAAAIEATGLGSGSNHQIRMGMLSFIYFSPEVARQWIGVLESIAEAGE